MDKSRFYSGLALLFLALTVATAQAKTWTVCPPGVTQGCHFTGHQAIQSAIDSAHDGDVVRVRAGVYTPQRFIDVPYKQYVIRGAVVLQHKRIAVIGETGAVLDGAGAPAISAIVVNGGEVTLSNLVLRNLRAGDPEDDLYEGHGVWVIDAAAQLHELTIEKYAKMALTGRGSAQITARRLRIQDGHVAIWLEESAHLKLCDSVVRNNDSAGLAIYGDSSAKIYNSVFDANLDDGLYAQDEASIFVTNSLVLNNKPYAVRVVGNGRAVARHTVLFGNEAKAFTPEGKDQIRWGPGILEVDPAVNALHVPGAARAGDPDVRTPSLGQSMIGLGEVAACQAVP